MLPAFPNLAALSAEQIAEYTERLFVAEMVRLRTVLCMKTVCEAGTQRNLRDIETHDTFHQEVRAAREQMEREVNDIELEGLYIREQLQGLLEPLERKLKNITSTAMSRASDTISTREARERIAQLEKLDPEMLEAASILIELATTDRRQPSPIHGPATPSTEVSTVPPAPVTPSSIASQLRRCRRQPASRESSYEPGSDTSGASTIRQPAKRPKREGQ